MTQVADESFERFTTYEGKIMTKWQEAHVGGDSTNTTFRTTDDEKKRLEDLRKIYHLTSKGQVIRLALDMLETITVASAMAVTGAGHREVFGRISDGMDNMSAMLAAFTTDKEFAATLHESTGMTKQEFEKASAAFRSGTPEPADPS